MLTATRRESILNRLRSSGPQRVAELADEFEVSPSTIRRDLAALSREGRLRRIRGGGTIEPDSRPYTVTRLDQPDEKDRIGKTAASLVRDGDVVIIDIGTTTAHLAKHLAGRDITVVTASLAVIDHLRDEMPTELIVLGGVYRRSYLSMVGALTSAALSNVVADIAFLGLSGVSANGQVLDTTGIEIPVKHAILANSTRRVFLADHTKFPGAGILPICGPEQVDTLVTTPAAEAPGLDKLLAAGTEVIYA